MSADEAFVLTLVIGSIIAIVSMAVQSRRTRSSSAATANKDVSSAKKPVPPAVRQAGE